MMREMAQRTGPGVIRTHSGNLVNVFDPDPDLITIGDIAHGLSHVCRFGGHTPRFYSVAQHSLMVSGLIYVRASSSDLRMGTDRMRKLALEALLHDASEAYLGDMPTPIKAMLPEYQRAEQRMQEVISLKFGVGWPFHELVHAADAEALDTEFGMFDPGSDVTYMGSGEAEREFLLAFKRLTA